MLDAEKLQELKDKNILSEEELVEEKHRLVARILHKETKPAAKNGIIYILLAFFLGAIGIHNLYAKYWKRGFFQFFLALISPYMLFIPLIFTGFWALLELLFVNRGPDGTLFSGNRRIIWLLRVFAVLSVVWFASSTDMVVQDVNLDIME